MGRRYDVIDGSRGRVGSRGGVIGGLGQQNLVRDPLGVAFLKFGHLQVMARHLEIPLAHVETRRGLGKMQIFGGAIAISPRPNPKSEFAYGISSWQAATHKMQD
jgi:hypothetical protein